MIARLAALAVLLALAACATPQSDAAAGVSGRCTR